MVSTMHFQCAEGTEDPSARKDPHALRQQKDYFRTVSGAQTKMLRLGLARVADMGLHQATRKKVYDALVWNGAMTPALVAAFDPRTARHVKSELGDAGWLQILADGSWAAGPAVGHVLVFDISWRQIGVALCDVHGTVLKHKRRLIALEPRQGNPDSVKTLRSRVHALTQEILEGSEPPLIVGATVVWPTAIPRDPRLPVRPGLRHRAWRNVDLRHVFSDEISKCFRPRLPVFFQNDADAEALGETHYGIGRGCRNLLLIKICEGIGAALIVDGHVYEGADGKAGEIGHVVPNLPDEWVASARTPASRRQPCTCGSKNHLESYASTRAMIGELFPNSDRSSYAACVDQMISRRDEFAEREVLERCGTIIGRTLRPIVQMLNPDRIVVSAEPDDQTLFDNIVSSLTQQIDGDRLTRKTRAVDGQPGMSLRGGALSATREYLLPRLRHGVLGEPWAKGHDDPPTVLSSLSKRHAP